MSDKILRAVARRLHFHQGTLVPEACVTYKTGERIGWGDHTLDMHGQYLADLMWVTNAGYATEFEIKISLSDWRADAKKGKWRGMPSWISRFIYAVPATLGVPDFVPEFAGVWHYHTEKDGFYAAEISVARAPRRFGKERVPEAVLHRWLRHLYSRYWYQKLYHDRRVSEYETRERVKKRAAA